MILAAALMINNIIVPVDSFPLSAVSMYPCVCNNCEKPYFVCRNTEFYCNCEECSCYSSNIDGYPTKK